MTGDLWLWGDRIVPATDGTAWIKKEGSPSARSIGMIQGVLPSFVFHVDIGHTSQLWSTPTSVPKTTLKPTHNTSCGRSSFLVRHSSSVSYLRLLIPGNAVAYLLHMCLDAVGSVAASFEGHTTCNPFSTMGRLCFSRALLVSSCLDISVLQTRPRNGQK